MPIVRLDIAYHGAAFAGWAAQPGMRTVQEELEGALEQRLGERPRLTVAGRTDAGVHAWGQVASFETDAEAAAPELERALNALTPEDVAILGVSEADGFDARRDARSRTYCYRVLAGRMPNPFERELSLFWPRPVEVESLKQCAAALIGSHDFTAFTPTQTEHVRFEREILRCEWRQGAPIIGEGEERELLELWIEADAFMRSMVRALVGTMLEVAGGRRSVEDFVALLEGAPRERAGDTAQAHGLHLASVRY